MIKYRLDFSCLANPSCDKAIETSRIFGLSGDVVVTDANGQYYEVRMDEYVDNFDYIKITPIVNGKELYESQFIRYKNSLMKGCFLGYINNKIDVKAIHVLNLMLNADEARSKKYLNSYIFDDRVAYLKALSMKRLFFCSAKNKRKGEVVVDIAADLTDWIYFIIKMDEHFPRYGGHIGGNPWAFKDIFVRPGVVWEYCKTFHFRFENYATTSRLLKKSYMNIVSGDYDTTIMDNGIIYKVACERRESYRLAVPAFSEYDYCNDVSRVNKFGIVKQNLKLINEFFDFIYSEPVNEDGSCIVIK